MAQGKQTYPWSWSGTGEPPTTPPWGPVGRDLTLGLVASASKLWLQLLNRTTCQVPRHCQVPWAQHNN